MDGRRLIHSLALKNFLSYGSEGIEVELLPLNVLIGQNASGKSNFIEAIELLRAAPTSLLTPIFEGGGVEEFLYKGNTDTRIAELTTVIDYPETGDKINHSLSFTSTASGQNLQIVDETIRNLRSKDIPDFHYRYLGGKPAASIRRALKPINFDEPVREWDVSELSDVKSNLSILSQRNDPDTYPAITYIAEQYRAIKIYRDFSLYGPNSLRIAQRPDLPTDFLEENGRNLSLVLNDLQHREVMTGIIEKMRDVYQDIGNISVRLAGGTVQTFIRENGMRSPIPANRLSDGTLRYLCLLAILSHPEPPPLICIEEPEIGLHPDILPTIAEMLIEASQRTQLIVTTHSDSLVSALGRFPEAVLVCDRTEDGSQLHRLEPGQLGKWLEDYSLGELWRTGEIGGVRY